MTAPTDADGTAAQRQRAIAVAGHTGDETTARTGLTDTSPTVRAAAIGALERLGALTTVDITRSLTDGDGDVRRRAAQAAARTPDVDMRAALRDPEWQVVEMACWALGEHERATDETFAQLVTLAGEHEEPLVREAAVAALGAIGDPRGLPAIIGASHDKPAVRRRAAVALAPFEEPEAIDALRRLLDDRDWQTRQVAEDLLDERRS